MRLRETTVRSSRVGKEHKRLNASNNGTEVKARWRDLSAGDIPWSVTRETG